MKNIRNLNEELVLNIFKWSKAQISPICSIVGGFLSQEIIKAIGLYEPIKQWMFFDFYDIKIYPDDKNHRNVDNSKIQNNRYKEQISIFGEEIQNKLEKLNIFLIGAGAIGCEVLKNLDMMGVATKKEINEENNIVSVTDNDNIETSNLISYF